MPKQYRNLFRLIVADRGLGKAGTDKGFGSRMLGSDPGLRVTVTAPIADALQNR